MSILKASLPASAQEHLINKEVVATLTERNLFIEIEVQTVRPSTEWVFYGKAAYISDAVDQVIDTEALSDIESFKKAFGFGSKSVTVVAIYNKNNVFSPRASEGSVLIGYAVSGIVQSAGLGKAALAMYEHEDKLNQQAIYFDIEDLTLWKEQKVFKAYLTKDNGDVVACIKNIHNHHRNLETAVNRALKQLDTSKETHLAA